MATEAAPDAIPAALLALDRSDGSATIELYRAALGPWHVDYYLKAFTRFDAAGKAGASWNWTAALLSLNWLLFRQLWLQALSYVGALTAAVLLLLGIGRLLFQMPPASQWALGGLVAVLAFVVPGALGNAWLYAACNRKMEAALAASASVEEACALLVTRASGRKHQLRLAASNLAFFGLLAVLVMAWPDSAALAPRLAPVQEARLAPAAQIAPAVQPAPMAQLASAAAVASVAPAAATVASAMAVAIEPAAPGRTSQGPVQAAPVPVPVPIAVPVPVPVPMPPASAPAPTPKSPPTPASAAQTAKAAKPTTSPAAAEKYMINVGLFADPNNARNAYTRLKDAGLPALSQPLKPVKGKPRTRVRVGPYDTQAEADSAAERIRALKLDAAVFKP